MVGPGGANRVAGGRPEEDQTTSILAFLWVGQAELEFGFTHQSIFAKTPPPKEGCRIETARWPWWLPLAPGTGTAARREEGWPMRPTTIDWRRASRLLWISLLAELALPLLSGGAFWGFAGLPSGGTTQAAERVALEEDRSQPRIFQLSSHLQVEGQIFPQPGEQSALPLKVDAGFRYRERFLEGAGRQAQSLRAVRFYDQAGASITAGPQVSNIDLRNQTRLIVAHGTDLGVELFSPQAPLQFAELDLLHSPGDSLVIAALLPDSGVEPGDKWKPEGWVLPLLAGIEAVEKGALSCELLGVEKNEAKIRFQGNITGAVLGAAARVELTGELTFDTTRRCWTGLKLTQTEKRAVGPVSPGLDLKAQLSVKRQTATDEGPLTDTALEKLPLQPNAAARLLMFEAPAWNTRFLYERNWHLLTQNSDLAMLRLLEQGELLAQCTIKKLADAGPGRHVSEEVFQQDIRATLGKNYGQQLRAERIRVRDGLYVFRVVVVGTVAAKNDEGDDSPTPMQWIYYLVANADGRQLALVFTSDPKRADRWKDRDLGIVGGVEFLPVNAVTPRAASR